MNTVDLPSPIDLRDPDDARDWESKAQSRPGRDVIFQAIADELGSLGSDTLNILELGSGPGFLAHYLLNEIPNITISLLDFSPAMHELAQQRLNEYGSRTNFILRDFKDAAWAQDLSEFDAIITNQAVHELRHKRHASNLHMQARAIIKPGGIYLVSDHYYSHGGLDNDSLYMTIEEQANALNNAGYTQVRHIVTVGSLALYYAA